MKDGVLIETDYLKIQHYGKLNFLQEVLKGRPTTIKKSISTLFAPPFEASTDLKSSNTPAMEVEYRLSS